MMKKLLDVSSLSWLRYRHRSVYFYKMMYSTFQGQIGDWFVLYQLSKNCNPYFYREFIRELARDLRTKPKKSQSSGL